MGEQRALAHGARAVQYDDRLLGKPTCKDIRQPTVGQASKRCLHASMLLICSAFAGLILRVYKTNFPCFQALVSVFCNVWNGTEMLGHAVCGERSRTSSYRSRRLAVRCTGTFLGCALRRSALRDTLRADRTPARASPDPPDTSSAGEIIGR